MRATLKKAAEKPTKKAKNSYQHGNLKESLVRAAFNSIKTSNEVAFSMRELAKMVGVTAMAAYRHYPSKESILLALAQEGFEKLGFRFQEALMKDPSDLQAIGIAYVQFAIENPVYFRVMFHPDLHGPQKHEKRIEPRPEDRKAYQLLLACVALNQKNGKFKDKDTDALAITAWSTVHGLAALMVNGNLDSKYYSDPVISKKVIERTTALVLSGLENSISPSS